MSDKLLLSRFFEERGLEQERLDKVLNYIELVEMYSKKINLISEEDLKKIIKKHIIPSLLMVPQLRAMPHASILDLGSGSGIPGIPLKIALSESELVLVESRRKRANFLRETIRKLRLTRITVVNKRIEDWCFEPKEKKVDIVISKAVRYDKSLNRALKYILNKEGHVVHTLRSHEYSKLDKQGSLLNKTSVWRGIGVKWGVWAI